MVGQFNTTSGRFVIRNKQVHCTSVYSLSCICQKKIIWLKKEKMKLMIIVFSVGLRIYHSKLISFSCCLSFFYKLTRRKHLIVFRFKFLVRLKMNWLWRRWVTYLNPMIPLLDPSRDRTYPYQHQTNNNSMILNTCLVFFYYICYVYLQA